VPTSTGTLGFGGINTPVPEHIKHLSTAFSLQICVAKESLRKARYAVPPAIMERTPHKILQRLQFAWNVEGARIKVHTWIKNALKNQLF
jgi:hypothetical protein